MDLLCSLEAVPIVWAVFQPPNEAFYSIRRLEASPDLIYKKWQFYQKDIRQFCEMTENPNCLRPVAL